jgi:hypothetical protein
LLLVEDALFDVWAGAVGSNLLGSWLAPVFKESLDVQLRAQLSRESLEGWTHDALSQLEKEPGSREQWLILAALAHGRPMAAALTTRLDDITDSLQTSDLVFATAEGAFVQLACMSQLLGFASMSSKDKFLEVLLTGLDGLLDIYEVRKLAQSLYQISLNLWRSEGPSGSASHCEWLEKFSQVCPELAVHWLPGMTSMAWELPPSNAQGAFRCLVVLRSR